MSEVPEKQLKELAEIKKKGGLHAMHQSAKGDEEDMKHMDHEEEMKHESSRDLNESAESLEENDGSSEENKMDDYVNYLKEMERKYLLTKLLEKYFDEEN